MSASTECGDRENSILISCGKWSISPSSADFWLSQLRYLKDRFETFRPRSSFSTACSNFTRVAG